MSVDPASHAASTDESSSVAALEVVGLTKRFGGLSAVDDITFSVPERSVFGLLGPNGAGKTTVLNIISGLMPSNEGEISVFGERIDGLPAHRVARAGVARTYQNVRLFPALTVLETVISGMYTARTSRLWQSMLLTRTERRERRECVERARALLDRVGITAPPDRLAEALSYGEQRRVEIARALATGPRLILLDEPTAGMNATESDALGELLHSLRNEDGITLMLIEHNIKLVLRFCELAVVMNFGQRIAQGTPRACVDDPDVQAAYFGKRSDAERLEALLRLRSDHRPD